MTQIVALRVSFPIHNDQPSGPHWGRRHVLKIMPPSDCTDNSEMAVCNPMSHFALSSLYLHFPSANVPNLMSSL